MENKYTKEYATYLFARPSFIEGVARILDFGGTLNEYNYSSNPKAADVRAMQSDWRAVGDDIRQAMSVVAREGKVKPTSRRRLYVKKKSGRRNPRVGKCLNGTQSR